jgi:hypothetical protein
LLRLLPIAETSASRVNIDFITKFPATAKDSYNRIITIVNSLTKRVQWIDAREKDLTAEAFAREFIDMLVRNREIQVDIISYRDMCFISDFWVYLTAHQGINYRRSTAYQLQTNGQADDLNTVVECYLKGFVAQCQKEWDCLLQLAELAYTAAYHMSLKTPPFRADLGFMPWMLIYLLVPILSADLMLKLSLEADDFAKQTMSDLRMLRELVVEAQTGMILEAYKSRYPHHFKVGDSVFLDTRLFPITYANLTQSEPANVNS